MANNEKLYVDLAAKLIEDNIDRLFSKATSLAKKALKSIKIKTKAAFKKYYKTSVKEHLKSKTILHREKPINLYDFYVDLDLKTKDDEVVITHTFSDMVAGPIALSDMIVDPIMGGNEDIMNKLRSDVLKGLNKRRKKVGNHFLITGTAGSGKTTLIKHLFLSSIQEKQFVPVFVSMRNINIKRISLIDFIYDSLNFSNFNLDKENFLKLAESGKMLFFFDGFDEINSSIAGKVGAELLDMAKKYNESTFVVTSRPDEAHVGWSNFIEYEVKPLSKEKSIELVRKTGYDEGTIESFVNKLSAEYYDQHTSFASNPLLVTIMLMVFNENAEIPNKMNLFYSQAFETLFCKHDATKAGYKRLLLTDLQMDDFIKILSLFCVQTYFRDEISFSYESILEYLKKTKKVYADIIFKEDLFFNDLVKALCILVRDGTKFTFTHRTFQEYFSALYIMNSDQSTREKLIKLLFKKETEEMVSDFIFEKNRKILEKSYIIDALKRIKKTTKYGKIDLRDSYFIFAKNCFSAVYVRGKDMHFKLKNQEFHKLIRFVYKHYHRTFKTNHIGFFYSQEDRQNFSDLLADTRGIKKDIKQSKFGDLMGIAMQDIAKKQELLKLFKKVGYLCREYNFSMGIIDKLTKENKKIDQSINKILFPSDRK